MKLLSLLLLLSGTNSADHVKIVPRMLNLSDITRNKVGTDRTSLIKEEKIFWGRDANATTAPFQILLSYENSGLCGGAIIDPWWIVTAAHCTVLEYKILKLEHFEAWAGTLHVEKAETSEQLRVVDMVFPHENYDDQSLSHDVALLHMKDPLILNENVSVISIADNTPVSGSTVQASGYGLTETNKVATTLQYIEQSVPPRPDCLNIYGSLLDDTMWCSGEEDMKGRAGKGDSGGPLIQILDNIPKLVGLVSYSIDIKGEPSYDINSDVAKMKSWIINTMNRTWVELNVTKAPQAYSWSNSGLNYQTEHIKMECHTSKFCRVQIKSFAVDFRGSKHGKIRLYHSYDMTKDPIAEIRPDTYSAVQLDSGFASNTKQLMLIILLGQDDALVDLTFTYQVLDDSACREPASQCNEVVDCLDLSDEIGCVYSNKTESEMSEYAVGCYPSDFQCPNVGLGVWCVRRTHVCNGYTDCIGGADETDLLCSRGSDVKLTLGVLFFMTLFRFLT